MKEDPTVSRRTPSNHSVTHLRLPHADPRTKVAPARPHAVHVAIVIVALSAMFVAALVAAVAMLAGRTDAVLWPVVAVTVCGMLVLAAADYRFTRDRR